MDFGIITIATGNKRFIKLAKNLALSLSINNPGWARAVLTDSNDSELNELFDFVINFNEKIEAGFIHKLYMYDYSPFKETLFIDSDSLVIAPIDELFKKMKVSDVSAQGFKFTDRIWAGVHASKVLEYTKAKYLIMHNGGIYYYKKSLLSEKVFAEAKRLLDDYNKIGFYKLRGKTAHEPLMSTAMSIHGMNAFDDENMGMRTFVDISSELKINVIQSICEFYEFLGDKRRKVNPIIVHFSGSHADWFHYKREATKLKLCIKFEWMSRNLINSITNIIYNPPYILFIFIYRLLKAILGKEKFKLRPLMPTLRYK